VLGPDPLALEPLDVADPLADPLALEPRLLARLGLGLGLGLGRRSALKMGDAMMVFNIWIVGV
jgi:hypothetical protein